MRIDGYFNASDRCREKQESRARDEHHIAVGVHSANFIAQRNGLFSALDPSQARINRRRVHLRLDDAHASAA